MPDHHTDESDEINDSSPRVSQELLAIFDKACFKNISGSKMNICEPDKSLCISNSTICSRTLTEAVGSLKTAKQELIQEALVLSSQKTKQLTKNKEHNG